MRTIQSCQNTLNVIIDKKYYRWNKKKKENEEKQMKTGMVKYLETIMFIDMYQNIIQYIDLVFLYSGKLIMDS